MEKDATVVDVTTDLDLLEAQVRDALVARETTRLRRVLAGQYPADVADVIDRLPPDEQLTVFQLLAPDQAADVLDEAGADATRSLLDRLPTSETGALLDLLPADDAAEVLSEDVSPQERAEYLAAMTPADAAEVRALLHYPAKSAGRLMSEKFVRIAPDLTATEVVDHLRRIDPEIETLTDVYVFDDAARLIGVASLRQVITAPPESQVRDFMATHIVSVTPETDQEEVARLIARYDFLAMPVVIPDGRMLGIVTVDDVIDVLTEEDTEDQLRFGAVEPGVGNQPYFTTPIWRVVRSRVGWLVLLFLAETLTGSVLRVFEDELARVVALSFFIPLLIGTGGNTGSQTVSTIIRGMALGEIRLRDTGRVLGREIVSGVLLGTLLGLVAFGRSELWGSGTELSLVVGLTVLAIVIWANTIGALVPLVAQRLKIDPALVSAPLITTLVDATGLAIYLLIAKAILTALR